MISLARETQSPRLGQHTVYAIRLILATVWLFWGIRSGGAQQPFGGSAQAVSLAGSLGMTPGAFSMIIQAAIILLALWLVAGRAFRRCVVVQLVVLLFFWWLNYRDWLTLLDNVIGDLPMILLLTMLWWYGPGNFVWSRNRRRRSTWTRG